jgi:sulfiredoxin
MASAFFVAVAPDFSSKSSTGSMIAHLPVAGSDTTYWMEKVRLSKMPFTSGLAESIEIPHILHAVRYIVRTHHCNGKRLQVFLPDDAREKSMLRSKPVPIDAVYVPTARRKTLHPDTSRVLAEDILENGLQTPIQVREDGARYVLVEGLHRLEAMKFLGETTIEAYLVQARRH